LRKKRDGPKPKKSTNRSPFPTKGPPKGEKVLTIVRPDLGKKKGERTKRFFPPKKKNSKKRTKK